MNVRTVSHSGTVRVSHSLQAFDHFHVCRGERCSGRPPLNDLSRLKPVTMASLTLPGTLMLRSLSPAASPMNPSDPQVTAESRPQARPACGVAAKLLGAVDRSSLPGKRDYSSLPFSCTNADQQPGAN